MAQSGSRSSNETSSLNVLEQHLLRLVTKFETDIERNRRESISKRDSKRSALSGVADNLISLRHIKPLFKELLEIKFEYEQRIRAKPASLIDVDAKRLLVLRCETLCKRFEKLKQDLRSPHLQTFIDWLIGNLAEVEKSLGIPCKTLPAPPTSQQQVK